MRFRLVSRGKGTPRPAAVLQKPESEAARPRPGDLDNPYGRYYSRPRSREELKKRRI